MLSTLSRVKTIKLLFCYHGCHAKPFNFAILSRSDDKIKPCFELICRHYSQKFTMIRPLIIKITISSVLIGLKKAYFPLIRLPSCYRTVCYWIVCYWIVCYWIVCYWTVCYRTVCYRTVQKANHIQRCSLKQPITFKVVITCACTCACFCVFAFFFCFAFVF